MWVDVDVKETTLGALLKKYTFAVPAFQRRYAWRERNFTQLWEDIETVLEGQRKRHFMCTVVFQRNKGARLTVIDGQQRLITFTIVLKVLYDISLRSTQTQGLPIKGIFSKKVKQFIEPSLHDRAALSSLLDDRRLLDKSVESKGFKECYDFFSQHIERYLANSTGQVQTKFSRVYEAIVEKMVFVEILLADGDDTHAIFETINNSGVPLTAADLARNLVLSRGKTESEQVRLNREYWEPLEHKFSESVSGRTKSVRKIEAQAVLPDFLRAVLVVEKHKYISATDLFRELRSYFQPRELEDKLATLLDHAEIFCLFLNPAREKRKVVREQLVRLLDLRMTTYRPVLLVLFRGCSTLNFSAKHLVIAMQYIESFIVRRAFNSKVSRDLPKVFAKIAIELNAEMRGDRLLGRLSSLLANNGWPTNAEFDACFLATPIYAQAPATARFVLIRLEHDQKNANELNLDNSIHIEHIFPQSPKSDEWDLKSIPDLKKLLHVVGNLTLSEKTNNQSLSNQGFTQKLNGEKGYKRSPYWLSNSLKDSKTWTATQVDQRGHKLLRIAKKLWPHPN